MRLEDVQIGQRVRCLGNNPVSSFTGVVHEIHPHWFLQVVVTLDPPRCGIGSLRASELELLEPVAPVIDWQARAERAEADADRLARALARPLAPDFDARADEALEAHYEAVTQR